MSVEIAYDKAQLRSITKSFKAMSDEAIDAAKRESSALAEFLQLKVRETAQRRTVSGAAVRRVAEGSRVAKSSKIGEVSFGFAAQKFSGGGSVLIATNNFRVALRISVVDLPDISSIQHSDRSSRN